MYKSKVYIEFDTKYTINSIEVMNHTLTTIIQMYSLNQHILYNNYVTLYLNILHNKTILSQTPVQESHYYTQYKDIIITLHITKKKLLSILGLKRMLKNKFNPADYFKIYTKQLENKSCMKQI